MADRAPDFVAPPQAPEQPEILTTFKRWLKQSENARRPFERDWKIAAAFLQNKQWIGWDERNKRVVQLRNPQKRIRYTVNVLTGYYGRFQGKLLADDSRPDVTFRREDVEGKSIADEARRALEYAWEEEADADTAYALASAKRLTYGIGFVRVRPSPDGKDMGEFPIGPDGLHITDPKAMNAAVEQAFQTGEKLEWKMLREARLSMEAGGPFELYPPPGIEHESLFPWLIIGRPVALNVVKGLYPKAANLTAEPLQVVDTLGLTGGDDGNNPSHAKLHDHIMLYTGYELPCPDYTLGRECVWARDTLLEESDQLPYVIKGEAKVGIGFFKFREMPGRWWPMGMVEPGVGAQRQINHSRSQNQEIKDRIGLPRVYATENTITEVNRPKGFIGEVINIRPGYELPREMQGVGPGAWVQQEAELCKQDMDTVMTLRADASAAPPGVTAYSAYAHFNEQEDQAIGPIRKEDRKALKQLAWFALHTIREYWPPEKHIAVAGKDDLMDTVLFRRADLPEEFYISIGKGAPGPQSQAARIQLAMDLFDRGLSSGQVQPLHWLYDSLIAGKPLPLVTNQEQGQEELAQFENLLIGQGQQVAPMPHHNHQVHIAQHRAAQTAYEQIPGYEMIVQALEMHIQQHMMLAAGQAAQVPPGQAAPGAGGQGGQAAGLGPAAAAAAAGAA